MSAAQVLCIKKLTGKSIVRVAARHNYREIVSEFGVHKDSHIDPARIALNRILHGPATAELVAAEAKLQMTAAGVERVKKTAVMAVEIVFSLPPRSAINSDLFFSQSVKWAAEHFNVPVLSAIVHNDEAAPHCHVILLPLVAGKMRGSDLVGGPGKLRSHQAAFHAQVAEKHGLRRPAPQSGHSASVRRAAARLALDVLKDNGELHATSDAVMNELLELIAVNPVKLLAAMGRTMPMPSTKLSDTFAGIMTRPTKPEPKPKRNHIGVSRVCAVDSEVPHTSEVIGIPIPAQPPTAEFHPEKSSPTLSCVGNLFAAGSQPAQPSLQNGEICKENRAWCACRRPIAPISSYLGGTLVAATLPPHASHPLSNDGSWDSGGMLNVGKTHFPEKSNESFARSAHGHHERRTPAEIQNKNESGGVCTDVRLRSPRIKRAFETGTQVRRMHWEDTRAPPFGHSERPPPSVAPCNFLTHTRPRVRARVETARKKRSIDASPSARIAENWEVFAVLTTKPFARPDRLERGGSCADSEIRWMLGLH